MCIIYLFHADIIPRFAAMLAGKFYSQEYENIELSFIHAMIFYAVVIKGAVDLGGFENVWKISNEGNRLEFFKYACKINIFIQLLDTFMISS